MVSVDVGDLAVQLHLRDRLTARPLEGQPDENVLAEETARRGLVPSRPFTDVVHAVGIGLGGRQR
jgi:hypothetical protein